MLAKAVFHVAVRFC